MVARPTAILEASPYSRGFGNAQEIQPVPKHPAGVPRRKRDKPAVHHNGDLDVGSRRGKSAITYGNVSAAAGEFPANPLLIFESRRKRGSVQH
jgi:hypothetical protein